jgi:hypothetical protein
MSRRAARPAPETPCHARPEASQAQRRGLDETHNPGDQLLEVLIGTDQIGPAKLVLQIADQLLRIVPSKMAQTPRSLCATRIAPREHWPTANRMSLFWPAAR